MRSEFGLPFGYQVNLENAQLVPFSAKTADWMVAGQLVRNGGILQDYKIEFRKTDSSVHTGILIQPLKIPVADEVLDSSRYTSGNLSIGVVNHPKETLPTMRLEKVPFASVGFIKDGEFAPLVKFPLEENKIMPSLYIVNGGFIDSFDIIRGFNELEEPIAAVRGRVLPAENEEKRVLLPIGQWVTFGKQRVNLEVSKKGTMTEARIGIAVKTGTESSAVFEVSIPETVMKYPGYKIEEKLDNGVPDAQVLGETIASLIPINIR